MATTTSTAESDLADLARLLGGGFHPDTRGSDYVNLPAGVTAEQIDTIVDAAFAAGVDVYAVACRALGL